MTFVIFVKVFSTFPNKIFVCVKCAPLVKSKGIKKDLNQDYRLSVWFDLHY